MSRVTIVSSPFLFIQNIRKHGNFLHVKHGSHCAQCFGAAPECCGRRTDISVPVGACFIDKPGTGDALPPRDLKLTRRHIMWTRTLLFASTGMLAAILATACGSFDGDDQPGQDQEAV